MYDRRPQKREEGRKIFVELWLEISKFDENINLQPKKLNKSKHKKYGENYNNTYHN